VYREAGIDPLDESEFIVKNSQVAILCGTILAGSLLVAGTNVWLIRSIRPSSATKEATPVKRLTIAMMPKAKGDPYFVSCRAGAEEAAKNLESI
jgi:rhamnose transport system permease protein